MFCDRSSLFFDCFSTVLRLIGSVLRAAMSKKAKADAENEDADSLKLKLHVLCGPHTSIKGLAYSSKSFDTVRLCDLI